MCVSGRLIEPDADADEHEPLKPLQLVWVVCFDARRPFSCLVGVSGAISLALPYVGSHVRRERATRHVSERRQAMRRVKCCCRKAPLCTRTATAPFERVCPRVCLGCVRLRVESLVPHIGMYVCWYCRSVPMVYVYLRLTLTLSLARTIVSKLSRLLRHFFLALAPRLAAFNVALNCDCARACCLS